MRIGLRLPDHLSTSGSEWNDPRALSAVATAAEAAGFDAVFVSDHPFPGADTAALGEHHTFDPFVTLAFLAAATTRLRLMTAIAVLPYRSPYVTAKAVATLDVLSGGRVVLGVGTGYMREEFAALGVDFERRNELTDDALVRMKEAWTGAPVREGDRANLALLTPVQRPHPPIWVGGNSRRAIRRAVEHGGGWLPFPLTPERAAMDSTAPMDGHGLLARALDYARDYGRSIGRTAPLDVVYLPLPYEALRQPDPVPYLEDARRLAALGVSYLVTQLPMTTRDTLLEAIRRFGDEVVPALNEVQSAPL